MLTAIKNFISKTDHILMRMDQSFKSRPGMRWAARGAKMSAFISLAGVAASGISLVMWLNSVRSQNLSEKMPKEPLPVVEDWKNVTSAQRPSIIKPWVEAQNLADRKDFDEGFFNEKKYLKKFDKTYVFVSVSGGALLGINSATFIDEIEKEKSMEGMPLSQRVYAMMGTSVGALIVLCDAVGKDGSRLGTFAAQEKVYAEGKFLEKDSLFSGLVDPAFSSKNLQNIINDFAPEDLFLSDLQTDVVIVAVNADRGETEIFSTFEARVNPERDVSVRGLAYGAAAAAIGFKYAYVPNRAGTRVFRLGDAGIAGLNNPAHLVHAVRAQDTQNKKQPGEQVVVLSLDNGNITAPWPLKNPGFLGFMMPGISDMPLLKTAINGATPLNLAALKAADNTHVIHVDPLLVDTQGRVMDIDPFKVSEEQWRVLRYISVAQAEKNRDTIRDFVSVVTRSGEMKKLKHDFAPTQQPPSVLNHFLKSNRSVYNPLLPLVEKSPDYILP